MTHSIRKAGLGDVPRLWEIRQRAILELAPRGMTKVKLETWAASMTIEGMHERFREAEIWATEMDAVVLAWIAIRTDCVDGLYTDPRFAERGVASELLDLAESLMWQRGIKVVRLESSSNAKHFYLRRGYQPNGDLLENDAIPLIKHLVAKGIQTEGTIR